MSKPYETIKLDHGIVIKILNDDSAENPIKEFDCEAAVSVWHRNYDFGNNSRFTTAEAFEEHFREQNHALHLAKNPGDRIYRLPVYLYDHSGLTVSTSPFSCPWDSGQVGWVWATRTTAMELWGIMDGNQEAIEKILISTVNLLNDYLTGNVYGYVVEDAEGNVLESCWGFYGNPDENVIPEAKSAAEYCVEQTAENAAVVESLAARAVERYQAEQARWPAI